MITQLNDAIDATLAFYGISAEQAARKRMDVDLSGMPAPMVAIYDRLGGMLEVSLNLDGYGPFRAGCLDLEYPFVDPELGLMIMTDSQNGPMFCISPDKTKVESVGHGNEFYWSAPIEKFLIDWLVDDWKYRLRWKLIFPDDDKNTQAYQRLKPQLTKLFTSEVMSGCTYYLLNKDILVIHELWGPDKDRVKCEFGAFHMPETLPSGAIPEKSQWHDETHSKWISAMQGLI